jgi:hypothetical protein
VSPGISPATRVTWVPANSDYPCDSGNLCALVWDPTVSLYKEFFLFTCNRYGLSNWFGSGFYMDNQTGKPTSYFYGQNGGVLTPPGPFQPGGGPQTQKSWDPVWSIRNC